MKKAVLLLLSMLMILPVCGQEKQNKVERPNNRKINFGIKAGFNSSMFLVSKLKIKDVTIDEFQTNYEIGYSGAFFMRFNVKKHFIQPEISYNVNKCEVTFNINSDVEPLYASVKSTIYSVDFPIMYGFNIVKQGPYGMSLYLGPNIRYIWNKKSKISFENFPHKGVHEELYPFSASALIGVAVNISRIFLDFRYEQGLHNISKSVTYDNIDTSGKPGVNDIIFRRRDNVLSFSLGVIF